MSAELKFELFEQELLNPLRGLKLSPSEEFIAGVLLDASSARPIGINAIRRLNKQLRGFTIGDREVKAIIRALKKHHELPVISRRRKPAGYWWCQSEEEMREYCKHATKQPLDELHTLSRIVKANYSRLAGQLNLEYSWCGNKDGLTTEGTENGGPV